MGSALGFRVSLGLRLLAVLMFDEARGRPGAGKSLTCPGSIFAPRGSAKHVTVRITLPVCKKEVTRNYHPRNPVSFTSSAPWNTAMTMLPAAWLVHLGFLGDVTMWL